MTRRPSRLLLALVAVAVTSCSLFQESDGYSEQELREDLAAYAKDFLAQVSTAANTIRDASGSREVRRKALTWQVSMPAQAHEAAFTDDPQEAYLFCLTVADLQTEYLTRGDGKDLFGAEQSVAVDAARSLSAAVRKIGERFIPEHDRQELEKQVAKLIENDPIKGAYFAISTRTTITKKAEEQGVISRIVSIPMSPFSALQGVGDTPAAIRDFSETAAHMASVVEALPRQLKWQTELLLYNVEDRDTVKQGLAAFEEASASLDRMSRTLESLPADLRGTIASVPEAITAMQPTVADARALVEALGPAAEQLRLGSEVWERILAPDPKDAPGVAPGVAPGGAPAEDSPPFNIQDWERTAEDIAVMAAELNQLSANLEQLLSPERFDQLQGQVTTLVNATDLRAHRLLDDADTRAQGLLDTSSDEARAVVDHAALRVGQLLLGFFLLLSIYRLTLGRPPKPVAPASGPSR